MEMILKLIGDNRDVSLFIAGLAISWRVLRDQTLHMIQKRNGGTHEDQTIAELRDLNSNMSNLVTEVRTSNRIVVGLIGEKE